MSILYIVVKYPSSLYVSGTRPKYSETSILRTFLDVRERLRAYKDIDWFYTYPKDIGDKSF